MEATAVTKAAMQNLMMLMSRIKTEEELKDLKRALTMYYAKRLDEEMDKLWEQGVINEDVLKGWENAHFRTPYKH